MTAPSVPRKPSVAELPVSQRLRELAAAIDLLDGIGSPWSIELASIIEEVESAARLHRIAAKRPETRYDLFCSDMASSLAPEPQEKGGAE